MNLRFARAKNDGQRVGDTAAARDTGFRAGARTCSIWFLGLPADAAARTSSQAFGRSVSVTSGLGFDGFLASVFDFGFFGCSSHAFVSRYHFSACAQLVWVGGPCPVHPSEFSGHLMRMCI